MLNLRSADNVYAFVAEVNGIPSDNGGLEHLAKVPLEVDWEPAIALWKICLPLYTNGVDPTTFEPVLPPTVSHSFPSEAVEPKFRVTGMSL